MNKKRVVAQLSIFVLVILTIQLASAAQFDFDNAQYQVTRVIDAGLGLLAPFFQAIIGDYSNSEFFFSKVLLLILLVIIIKNILDKSPISGKNKAVSFLISILISILAIRFINENNFFEAVLIQYGVLGIAITTVLPMVVFFYFIHNTNVGTYGRKVFWALYGITLGALWIMKSSEIPEVANWIYGLTFLAAMAFIFFDKSIHSYFGLANFKKFERKTNKENIRELRRDLRELTEDYRHGVIGRSEFDEESKEIREQIKELSKE